MAKAATKKPAKSTAKFAGFKEIGRTPINLRSQLVYSDGKNIIVSATGRAKPAQELLNTLIKSEARALRKLLHHAGFNRAAAIRKGQS